MDPAKYEYQSEWVRQWLAQGKAEGKAEGRAGLLIRLLTLRFGPLGDEVLTQIQLTSIEELDGIGERLLTARSLEEALGRQ